MRIFLLALLLCLTSPGYAHSGFSDALRSQYQRKVACQLCHTPKQSYTTFGRDFARLYQGPAGLLHTLKVLAELDSDQDGVTNQLELQQGSDPSQSIRTRHIPAEKGHQAQTD